MLKVDVTDLVTPVILSCSVSMACFLLLFPVNKEKAFLEVQIDVTTIYCKVYYIYNALFSYTIYDRQTDALKNRKLRNRYISVST